MNDYKKKQPRKAYVLFFVRQHSGTAHKARSAYRADLALMAVLVFSFGIVTCFAGMFPLTCLSVGCLVILSIAWYAS